jgi:hypothetical protein
VPVAFARRRHGQLGCHEKPALMHACMHGNAALVDLLCDYM